MIIVGSIQRPTIPEPQWRRQLTQKLKEKKERKEEFMYPQDYINSKAESMSPPTSFGKNSMKILNIFHRFCLISKFTI